MAGDKRPACAHGVLDASTDWEQIERWWTKTPNANLAIATQGLLVVDLDVGEDGSPNRWLADQPDRLVELAVAPLSLTPRGGRHYIFRQPEGANLRNTAGKIAPHVDTRADGGYILVPPSCVNGKQYRWGSESGLDKRESLPDPPAWLLAMLEGRAGASAPRLDRPGEANPIPSGQRKTTLASLGGTMRRVGMSEVEILAALRATNVERCVPPLDDDEVREVAFSIARYEPDQVAVAVAEDHFGQDHGEEEVERTPDMGPFPAELISVPGFIDQVVHHNLAGAYKPQPELALAGALALMAVLAGRKVTDPYGTRTNLYCLGVCRSGGGKERARRVNKDILHQAGLANLIGPESIGSSAGLVSAVEEHPEILLQLDEIGRLLKTVVDPKRAPHLYNIVTVLLKMFSSSSSLYIGEAYAKTEQVKQINQPHLCVYGTTVPDSLYESLNTESLTDGFLSRMLIFEAANHDPEPQDIEQLELPAWIIEQARWWGEFRPGGNLSDEVPQPIVIPYTDPARERFGELEALTRSVRRSDEAQAAIWARAVEKARKLALLWACSARAKSPVVDDRASDWAANVSEHLTRKLVWIGEQWISESAFDAKRKKILRAIKAKGGLTQSQLYAVTRAMSNRERAEILDSLILTGDVKTELSDRRGRQTTVYVAR